MSTEPVGAELAAPELPSVCAVIPAHARPVELRRAIRSVLDQEYDGSLSVIVVFDRAEPDHTLEQAGKRPVRVLENNRTPGLAGARNTGIVASDTELVAFCDDDDYWDTSKLIAQVEALANAPEAVLATTAMVVEYDTRSTVRLAGTSTVTHQMLVRSRLSMLHSSSLLFRRSALLGDVGLINEEIPGSQNEDWDILLRAAEASPITHVDEPLVHVTWGPSSFFRRKWDTKVSSNLWMLEQHPSVREDSRAAARLMGKIAFAHACSSNRREAWSWSAQTVQRDPRQWRGYLAAGVAVMPRSGELILSAMNRYGRGV
ncbi:glycosyltransferase [Ornithinimicrobium faecis]|uniref:Glycosyltransferase n=1 Tax=Ornithinimicrobium faecis TaxID=2934158 RepID=A0ABY4YUM8_9MICO|nr:glycosyltransferase [Ornithinimicrobium sp. HY1793]USQ80455.1 glycosyltransferase [Ornithinimicrobium sp. HY1793]